DESVVGRNGVRGADSARMRERRGLADPLAVAGDKLVCLRNNRRKGLFNGSLWFVEERKASRARTLRLRLKAEEAILSRSVKASGRPECFFGGIEAFEWREGKRYAEFCFGAVGTGHKAQGSPWA